MCYICFFRIQYHLEHIYMCKSFMCNFPDLHSSEFWVSVIWTPAAADSTVQTAGWHSPFSKARFIHLWFIITVLRRFLSSHFWCVQSEGHGSGFRTVSCTSPGSIMINTRRAKKKGKQTSFLRRTCHRYGSEVVWHHQGWWTQRSICLDSRSPIAVTSWPAGHRAVGDLQRMDRPAEKADQRSFHGAASPV